jgi:hydrogenase-4 component F
MTTGTNAAIVILALPAATAAALAALKSYRLSAALNVASAFVIFLASLSLFVAAPPPGAYILVDDLNIVFIVLNTFVGFTASVFSATYIAHEIETGRLTPANLRFYHAMYQFLLFSMNLALLANNIGLMWVAIELATLTTVLMVGVYRTPERRSRRRGNISFSAASALRSRCSARFSSTWPPGRCSAKACRECCGRS